MFEPLPLDPKAAEFARLRQAIEQAIVSRVTLYLLIVRIATEFFLTEWEVE